jgi:hypothetical protein
MASLIDTRDEEPRDDNVFDPFPPLMVKLSE